jgi:hypothetical protein
MFYETHPVCCSLSLSIPPLSSQPCPLFFLSCSAGCRFTIRARVLRTLSCALTPPLFAHCSRSIRTRLPALLCLSFHLLLLTSPGLHPYSAALCVCVLVKFFFFERKKQTNKKTHHHHHIGLLCSFFWYIFPSLSVHLQLVFFVVFFLRVHTDFSFFKLSFITTVLFRSFMLYV